MKTMRKLYDQCMEELDGVIEYSKCSMMYSSKHPDMAGLYFRIAEQELEHARLLHDMSKQLAESKIGTEDVDPRLMELWEEMENTKIEKMGLAKAYLENARM